MTIRNNLLGGTDWSDGQTLDAEDLNDTFDGTINNVSTHAKLYGGITPIVAMEHDGSNIIVTTDYKKAFRYTTPISTTIDGGDTWVSTGESIVGTVVSLCSGNTNYSIGYYPNSPLTLPKYTIDGGFNWTSITAAPSTAVNGPCAYSISKSGRVYCIWKNSSSTFTLSYTDTDGASWSNETSIATDTTVDNAKLMTPENDYIAYMVEDHQDDQYMGIKDGTTWTKTSDSHSTSGATCFAAYLNSDSYSLYTTSKTDLGRQTEDSKWQGNAITSWHLRSSNAKYLYLTALDENQFIKVTRSGNYNYLGGYTKYNTNDDTVAIPSPSSVYAEPSGMIPFGFIGLTNTGRSLMAPYVMYSEANKVSAAYIGWKRVFITAPYMEGD